MKNVYLALLTSVGITAGLLSCSQDKLEPTANVASKDADVSVINGRLRFSDGKTLRATLASLSDETASAKWEQQFAGFSSMRTAYTELVAYDIGKALKDGSIKKYERVLKITTEQDGQKSYERAVASSTLSTVLNSDGLVQIGDTLYRVDDVVTVAVPLQYESEINNDKPTHGVVRPIVYRAGGTRNTPGARALGSDLNLSQEYNPQGLTVRRFRGEVSISKAWLGGAYWSGGYKVWHQRNNWWGWGSENADQINVYVTVTRNGQCETSPDNAGVYRSSCNRESVSPYSRPEGGEGYYDTYGSSSVGTIRVDYRYELKGNGLLNNGAKYTLNRSGSYQE